MKQLIAIALIAGLAVACTPAEPPLAGGWTPVDDDIEGVREAEAFALDAIYREHPTRALVSSVTAEAQVVAGMNYRFHVAMSGAPEFRDEFEVVVYEDLEGNLEVTRLEQVAGE